jgi:hypothetical protein
VTFRLGKMVETEADKRLSQLELRLSSRIEKLLEVEVNKRLEVMEQRVTSLVKMIGEDTTRERQGLRQEYADGIKSLREDVARESEWVSSLIKALNTLPVPQVSVTVPDSAIQVNQASPQVILPESSIRVQVDQMPSQVYLPEKSIQVEVMQLPSQVNISDKAFHFTVDQPAPQVQVSVPQPRLVKKFISYDEHGRPSQIEESDV